MDRTTNETLALLKSTLANGSQALAKTVTTGTGLVAYDLQAPAKNLYPQITPLRNAIPRVSRAGNAGTATNWKQVTSLVGSGYNAMGWVPEGQRSGRMSYVTANKSASYVKIGEEDAITVEAMAASAGFEDENAKLTFRLLQKMMQKEEFAILGGNATLTLSTPTAPTLSASGTGGTLAAATYSVIVVALTLEGFNNSSVAGGVATSQTITGADNKTFVLSGGSSNKSAATTQAVTLGQTLFASTPSVNGALGYAWYTGVAGSEKLEKITTINSALFSAPLLGTGQVATSITTNNSNNPNTAFDGLLTTAFNSGTAYVNALATGIAGTGTPLTASGTGTVVEIDNMLRSMWDTSRISPTVMYVNSQELQNIKNKCLSNASAPLLHINQQISDNKGFELTAGGRTAYYFNPFQVDGGTMIPIRVHPNVPAGTILAYAERLPEWYQSNEVPNVAEVITRRDYYRMDWPQITEQLEYGVYAQEVLAVYFPPATAILTNIGNG